MSPSTEAIERGRPTLKGKLGSALTACALVTSTLASLGGASTGYAQGMDEDPPPTLQSSTGLSWGVAAAEIGLISATLLPLALSERERADAGGWMLLIASALAGLTGGLAQAFDAPVEPALVFHQGFTGALLMAGVTFFSATSAGVDRGAAAALGIGAMVAGAAAAATYSVLRMDRLSHDPELIEEAHLLSWVPLPTAGLFTAIMSAAGLNEAGVIVGAIVGLVAYGISVMAVEIAINENPPPDGMM